MLVVDDSVVIRRLVTDILNAEDGIEVVGTAINGKAAIAKLAALTPDLITLDIEMPEMDGIATLHALRAERCTAPVIMFSTLTDRGAKSTLEALSAGAADYVCKPANMGSVAQSMATVREQLVPKIFALCRRVPRRHIVASAPVQRTAAPAPTDRPAAPRDLARFVPRVVAIGCSTGGPRALTQVLAGLDGATFPLPIVVVQHMPPVFTTQFAAQLDRHSSLHVVEAHGGETLTRGSVFIAPGDHHLEVVKRGGVAVTDVNSAPAVSFCRPSVDVLFKSAAAAFGGAVLAVVLTGMGSDGRDGSVEIHRRGGVVIAQDEATSVVWGMPGSVASAGVAEQIVALSDLPAVIAQFSRRAAAPVAVK